MNNRQKLSLGILVGSAVLLTVARAADQVATRNNLRKINHTAAVAHYDVLEILHGKLDETLDKVHARQDQFADLPQEALDKHEQEIMALIDDVAVRLFQQAGRIAQFA